MTKADLVDVLIGVSRGKLDKEIADDYVTALLSRIVSSLLRGETVKLHNIGSLGLYKGSSRLCRDVVRGLPLKVPAKTRVRFVSSSVLRKKLAKLDEKRKNGAV